MSLRELPPEQSINTSRWRHLRYVPLVVLVILAAILVPVGYVVGHSEVPVTPAPEATPTATTERLPETCHPAVAAPAQEPWQGDSAEASEATFASHADDLAQPYVEGQDGWVFWGDVQANNFSQALGRRSLSPDELNQWHTYFATLDAGLKAEGIPLYVVIAPAKWSVYGDELPAWSQELRGSGPLDQLVAAGSDLPLIDLRAPLRAAAEDTQVYSRLNSHWSDYGALVGWNAIANCITASSDEFAGLAPLDASGTTNADFNEFADYGFTNPSPDWTIPTFETPLQPVSLSRDGSPAEVVDGDTRIAFADLPATTDLATAQTDKSLLFVGDSYGVIMSPYLQQSFSHTQQVRHYLDGDPSIQPDIMTLARTLKPDVVILEITQRHLNFPPAL